jgi:hypothetical protein
VRRRDTSRFLRTETYSRETWHRRRRSRGG